MNTAPSQRRRKHRLSLIVGVSLLLLGTVCLFLSASSGILAALGYIFLSMILIFLGAVTLIIRHFASAAYCPPHEETEARQEPPPAPAESSPVLPKADTNWDRIFQRQEEFDFPNRRPSPEDATEVLSSAPFVSDTYSSTYPKTYIVLDLETTGLSPTRDCIIEFGAIKIQNEQEIDALHMLINPERPIPPRITQITGITDADVAGAPPILAAIQGISDFIGALPIVAHNAPFDLGFLQHACAAAGLPANFTAIDTLSLSRKAFPNAPNHRLATLISYLNLGGCQEHRALSDVRYTNQIYRKCLSTAEVSGK